MNTNELLKIVAEMREWTWLPDRTPSVVMRDWADRLERLSASEATGGEPVAFVEYRLLGRARVEWLAPIPEPGTKLYATPPAADMHYTHDSTRLFMSTAQRPAAEKFRCRWPACRCPDSECLGKPEAERDVRHNADGDIVSYTGDGTARRKIPLPKNYRHGDQLVIRGVQQPPAPERDQESESFIKGPWPRVLRVTPVVVVSGEERSRLRAGKTFMAMPYYKGQPLGDDEVWLYATAGHQPAPADAQDAARRDCDWTYDDADVFWRTACGNAYEFTTDGPMENHHLFCPYCGGNLIIAIDAAIDKQRAGTE